MTITQQEELDGLMAIGRIVANTLQAMEPGMTTRELDALGRAMLDREGAISAPEASYNFPRATCIIATPGPLRSFRGALIIADRDSPKRIARATYAFSFFDL